MKGIILAGGQGTRLYPLTKSVSKQILPIYDKPMIYYPLSVLMLAEIREILIITTEKDLPLYENLLGDGKSLGLDISYAIQKSPCGIAQAFIIGEEFIASDTVSLILGDNFFYGSGLIDILQKASGLKNGALNLAYSVVNPKNFGVVEFNENRNVISIEEKPLNPKSNYAVAGLYFYDNKVVEIAKKIKPSLRGELEITSINMEYLKRGELKMEILGRGMTWLDTGTAENLLEASNFVAILQQRQGLYISCVEEIAFTKGFITREELLKIAVEYNETEYGKYLIKVAKV